LLMKLCSFTLFFSFLFFPQAPFSSFHLHFFLS
jgi:hypothetical protein